MNPRYERPRSVVEAARLLAGGEAWPLAGGTDLYAAHVGRPLTRPLVDLSRVEGLRGIRFDGGGRDDGASGTSAPVGSWTIGATTTWTDVLRADLPPLFDGLKAAAREVGGVQVQNAGTLAGNLCNASPAADGMPALLALDADVELASAAGSRRLPLAEFVVGPRRTARRADELVVALHVPARSAGARSVFLKLGGRRYLVISIAMVAAAIDVDAAGRIAWARVAVGSCSAVAQRLTALEARLLGRRVAARGDEAGDRPLGPRPLDEARPVGSLADVVEPADLDVLAPVDDVRGSADYRRDAAATLVRRAVAAFDRPRPPMPSADVRPPVGREAAGAHAA